MSRSTDSSGEPLPDITVLNTDPLLGADSEGNLYDGQRVRVGWDQLDVVTVISNDGDSFERSNGYGDHLVSKSTVTKEGFLESPRWADADQETKDAAWAAECAITSNAKVFIDAYVDGELTTVEKTLTFIDWAER